MESRTVNAERNIIVGVISKVILTALPFAVRTVMIYQLGALYLGLNSLFTSVLQVLSLAELGFGEAMVFSMYKPIAENDGSKICALLNLYKKIYRIIGIVVLVIGIALIPFLPKMISGEVPADVNLYLLYAIYLVQTVSSYFLFAYKSSLLTASQRSDINSLVSLITYTAQYVIQIVVLITSKNYYLYILVALVRVVVNNLIVERITIKKYPNYYCKGELNKSELTDIEKRVAGLFIFKISGVLRNSFDSIILSAFLGLVVLAQYQNYYYILSAVSTILSMICSNIVASVGNSVYASDKEKNYKDFRKFLFLFMWLACICTTCLYTMYQPFMQLWVGEDLMFSNTIVVIFCVYFFCCEMGMICYVYRQATGLWWQDRFRPIVEGVMNLTLNIILVMYIGVTGVLLSTIIGLILIDCIWGSWTLFKHYFTDYKNTTYLMRLALYALATVLSCGLAGKLCSLFSLSLIPTLFVNCFISVVVGFAVFIVFTYFVPERKEAVAFTKSLIRRKL